ncbi:MAG: YbgC/FadM family acyl-CoA thioesterase [Devosiaceae bacterium]|nr:YbgC/FadM family acyl-CoA thioesterase [Devosiaceae bacterium MH13]
MTQAFDVPEGSYRFPIRVYYEDTDLAGIVYHSNYLKFMERGRTEALRTHGIDQTSLAPLDRFLTVLSMDIQFKAPARIDDALEVITTPVSHSGVRGRIDQRVMRGETVLCTAVVMVVCLTSAGRPVRMPTELQTLFPNHMSSGG